MAITLARRDAVDRREFAQAAEVPDITIGEVLAEEVDLSKIDREGSEFEILAAEPELLKLAPDRR